MFLREPQLPKNNRKKQLYVHPNPLQTPVYVCRFIAVRSKISKFPMHAHTED